MNDRKIIRIAAFISDGERPAVEAAERRLAEALTEAEGMPRVVEVDFVEAPEQLAESEAIRVVSLLPEVARCETPWRQEEARLRALYAPLCESGSPFLFLTILRHVDASGEDGRADRIRLRIRRLNLLAIELSREHAVCVIDLDRVLADVGARRLRTDYRLGGDAVDLAAKTIATGIVVDALDAVIPFEVQDRARAIIVAQDAMAATPAPTMGQNLMTLGTGRRRQTVSAVTQAVPADHVGWLIRQVVRGRIGPRDAISKVGMAVRRRGARDSVALLTSGIGRMIGLRR